MKFFFVIAASGFMVACLAEVIRQCFLSELTTFSTFASYVVAAMLTTAWLRYVSKRD